MAKKISHDTVRQTGEKILIVNDEDAIRSLFVETLEELGYRCDVAGNCLEALKKFYRVKDFDVVLLDIQMPRLNGIEALKKLKNYSPDLSIIMVSASCYIENVRAALKDGAYDYAFKHFHVTDVDTVIRRAIERSNPIKLIRISRIISKRRPFSKRKSW